MRNAPWLITASWLACAAPAYSQGCGQQNPNCIVPTAPVGTSNNQAASTAFVKQNTRNPLAATQNYYVNGNSNATAACGVTGGSVCSAGNDNNDCLTPATACLTLQHMINMVTGSVDLAGHSGVVNLAHGTSTNYSATCFAPIVGLAVLTIQGDNNAPTAVVIQPQNSGNGITVKDLCTLGLVSVAFADSPGSSAVDFINVGSGNYGHVDLSGVTFGACASCTAIEVDYGGSVTVADSASQVTGNEAIVLLSRRQGAIDFAGNTFAGSSSLTFSTAFAEETTPGAIVGVNASTFTGFSGVTGTRCLIYGLGTIPAVNPNAIYPGNADCVIQTQIGAIALQTGSGGSSAFSFGTAGHALLSGGGTNGKDTWDTAGVSCPSGVTAATVVVVAGIVTHC